MGPALPDRPPCAPAWIVATLWATVSRANVVKTPRRERARRGGDQVTAPVEDIVTTALSVGTEDSRTRPPRAP
jgi:hypothetical protein